jgi:WD40 repeat protein
MTDDFHAYVAAALFCKEGAAFALGDGMVRFEGGRAVEAHQGAILCAAVHPGGSGLITGGDDGRLVWSRPDEGAVVLAQTGGKWIDALDVSPSAGLIAYASGRDLVVRDAADAAFERRFAHERSVAAVAFEPKGRRIAAATYGGVALRFARIAEQKPTFLKWAGSHIGLAWAPDARFLLSAMQENDLHGWRMSDMKDLRMGGYPAKVRSFAFLSKGALLATAGAHGAVVWPFIGAAGPMGREAAEVGFDESALITRVAAALAGSRLFAGLDDGRIWAADMVRPEKTVIKAAKGAPITALAISPDGTRLAWGDEDGGAAIVAV